jgi:hypothetical protein
MSFAAYKKNEVFVAKVVLPPCTNGRFIRPSAIVYDKFRKVYEKLEITDELVVKVTVNGIYFKAWYNKKKKLILGEKVEGHTW